MSLIPFVQSEQDFEQYLKESKGLVVNFTASWCGPCKAIQPIIEKLHESFTNIEIVKADIDSVRPLASKFQISAVPTFVFFANGKEINRIRGVSVQSITEEIQKLSQSVGNDGKRRSSSNSGADGYETSDEYTQVAKYIPNGFTVLNNTIFFGEYETLNTEPVDSSGNTKDLVRKIPETSQPGIVSDADSQILIHIPLTNVVKVYSILIKINKSTKYQGEQVQIPNKIKVWNNNTSIISFEHAETVNSLHDVEIDENKIDQNGWYELKLKYVRFQKVTSLDIFLDGDDEDEHTSIERILIIGVDGESKNQGKVVKIED